MLYKSIDWNLVGVSFGFVSFGLLMNLKADGFKVTLRGFKYYMAKNLISAMKERHFSVVHKSMAGGISFRGSFLFRICGYWMWNSSFLEIEFKAYDGNLKKNIFNIMIWLKFSEMLSLLLLPVHLASLS